MKRFFSLLGLRVKISQTRLGQECLQPTKRITIQTDKFLYFSWLLGVSSQLYIKVLQENMTLKEKLQEMEQQLSQNKVELERLRQVWQVCCFLWTFIRLVLLYDIFISYKPEQKVWTTEKAFCYLANSNVKPTIAVCVLGGLSEMSDCDTGERNTLSLCCRVRRATPTDRPC